jgi:hypothetical protein
MFGFVTANLTELSPAEKKRYNAVYCGICRRIRENASNLCRLGLSYDMAFLALLLMSLYEPAETHGHRACCLHPIRPKPWIDNEFIAYAADMNVALACYNARDDWQDDRRLTAAWMSEVFGRHIGAIEERYPRQCGAIRECITELNALEQENCSNPDRPARLFGRLMGEILVYREDLWAPTLRELGMALGRFIYLADAAVDYRRDARKGKYNPWIAMGMDADWQNFDTHLVHAMSACTRAFEKLPLVQDKPLLNNILYSGVWCSLRGKKEKGAKTDA